MSAAAAKADDLEDQLIDDIAGFYDDPLGFVRYAYPWGESGPLKDDDGPDEWQTDFLTKVGEAVKSGASVQGAIRIAVASGHGIGKTAVIAWLVQWFMATREFPQIVVTASTQTQLNTKTWRELAKWHRLLICRHWFQWTATKFYHVKYPETWFASAIPWSENNADAFAGTHEKYVLIIYDEASAIADTIWETTEGALTTPGALWLVFGNYTKNTGRFNDCFAGLTRNRWIRLQVDSRTAKKANKTQIQQWIDDYGEDSDFVRIRVRGIAPRGGSDQFISQDIVDRALKAKAVGYEALPKILTLDVARKGQNQSVAGVLQGRKFRIAKKWRELPIDQLVDRFCEVIDAEKPDAIVVDGDGIGGTVCDFIRRKKYDKGPDGRYILVEFHGASPAHNVQIYFNRRAEVWGLARDWLSNGGEIPDDKELTSDLVGPEYYYTDKAGFSVIQLERKEDMEARGVASPDSGDSLAMAFAAKVKALPRKAQSNERPRVRTMGAGSTDWMAS